MGCATPTPRLPLPYKLNLQAKALQKRRLITKTATVSFYAPYKVLKAAATRRKVKIAKREQEAVRSGGARKRDESKRERGEKSAERRNEVDSLAKTSYENRLYGTEIGGQTERVLRKVLSIIRCRLFMSSSRHEAAAALTLTLTTALTGVVLIIREFFVSIPEFGQPCKSHSHSVDNNQILKTEASSRSQNEMK
ncbi:unnamed protein product [Caenorhabditis auriculariae]|uniref:Uncharacterized protein n=1 Tax=Caenorhabditis auriculariae TaxID=2777116 RepID=A0A8S1HBD1_9PELO|nr:unnamed protein product [Caenorhabditis auriculariae]